MDGSSVTERSVENARPERTGGTQFARSDASQLAHHAGRCGRCCFPRGHAFAGSWVADTCLAAPYALRLVRRNIRYIATQLSRPAATCTRGFCAQKGIASPGRGCTPATEQALQRYGSLSANPV